MWSDWLAVCDCGFSLSALWCPLLVPTILLGVLLTWTWGISSRLFQQSTAATPYLGCWVSPHSCCSWPWMWGISSQPLLLSLDMEYLLLTTLAFHSHHSWTVSTQHWLHFPAWVRETPDHSVWWDEKASCPDLHGAHMHVFTQEKFILDDDCVFLSEGQWIGFYLKSPSGVLFCWFSKMKGVA